MGILSNRITSTISGFNDLAVHLYGIPCILYIPNNLDSVEGKDIYTNKEDITYTVYNGQKVWVEWFAKDFDRLRKLGIFSEGELPIVARFQNFPEIKIQSYIKVPIKYLSGSYNTDEFEVVNVIMTNTYNTEVLRRYKLAPRRVGP